MIKKNKGIEEDEILQNQFTAYLTIAIKRRRARYLHKKATAAQMEVFSGDDFLEKLTIEPNMLQEFNSKALDLIDNTLLLQALQELKPRNLEIFILKVVEEKTFVEIAKELGLGYEGVVAIYYRTLKKLRDKLGDEAK